MTDSLAIKHALVQTREFTLFASCLAHGCSSHGIAQMAACTKMRLGLLICALVHIALVQARSSPGQQPTLLNTGDAAIQEAKLYLNPARNELQQPTYIVKTKHDNLDQWLDDESYLIHVFWGSSYTSQGWDRLQIMVNPIVPIPDTVKAHAAGYAEAFFTCSQIYQYWENYRLNEWRVSGGQPSPGLTDFIDKQVSFIRSKVERKAGSSKYWRLLGLVMAQLDGLVEGYQQNTDEAHHLTFHDLYLLQSLGDLYDLNVLFPPTNSTQQQAATQAGTPQLAPARRYTPGHGEVGSDGYGEFLECSALIKIMNASEVDLGRVSSQGAEKQTRPTWYRQSAAALKRMIRWAGGWKVDSSVSGQNDRHGQGDTHGDASSSQVSHSTKEVEFWAGHTTWRPYYAMRRTWKTYVFPWSESGPLVVSSSPGLLFSKDDWYTTDKFVLMETTNGVYNKTLYDLIHPHCALMWQRALVASYGAGSGKEWVDLFAKHQSGTYNNQWMVLDVEALQAGWQHDVLWVLEQLPGMTEQADVTDVLLSQGHWASFNVPYFPSIYNISGYPQEEDMWHTCPRAQIFARDAPRVNDLDSMKRLLRYNRYQHDGLSLGRPNNAIAARYDLMPTKQAVGNWTRKAFGAVDGKIVSHHSFKSRSTHVVCGPTTDDQPPFTWSTSGFNTLAHTGLVDRFAFDWQEYSVFDKSVPRAHHGVITS